MEVSRIHRPSGRRLPLLISTPHVGTHIPSEMTDSFAPGIIESLRDTDWLVHELYRFSVGLGITLIEARFSRYVVDLNRPSLGPSLYVDNRRQTDVVPLTDFDGAQLYKNSQQPDATERQRRIQLYYEPYHQTLRVELAALQNELKSKRGAVVLLDAHSIRRCVPSLDPQPFPDLIIGDRDGTSAAPHVSKAFRQTLEDSSFKVSYNQPFKGGQITRAFGRPEQGVHAVQLEMSQDLYLQETCTELDPLKVRTLQPLLEKALLALAQAVR